MACRNCSAGLGLLPMGLAGPLRQRSVEITGLQRSVFPCASRAKTTATTATTATIPVATAQTASTPIRAARRAFHTSPARQKVDLKKMLIGRIAETFVPGKSSYYIYKATERMYKACAAQADYTIEAAERKAGTLRTAAEGEEIGVSAGGPWHGDLGLLPTFSTWAQVTMLHMYLFVVRLRCLDRNAQQAWQAQLVNHFFYHAEAKMEDAHELTSRMIRQRYLKDLFVQWRGLILAYDEGLVKGDAVLASAVWRNLFKAREDVDLRALAAVVAWMRTGLRELGEMADETVELAGEKAFPSVGDQLWKVDKPAAAMKAAFEQAGLSRTSQ